MAKKRPLAPPASPTDEWGIYDPAKAGMQALYTRLGRPILRASAASERRRERKRLHPEHPAEGVGLAIQEAQRRAGLITAAKAAPPPPPEPPPPPPVPVSVPEVAAKAGKKTRAKVAKGSTRKPAGDAVVAAGALADEAAARAAAPPPATAPTPRAQAATAGTTAPRAARKSPRARQATKAVAAPPPKPAPSVPPPSPRRPRGAVPLAAWAHAVSDSPRPEPKRSEAKGLWRGIFRIPSEVALVEYGRGCRIHRLVIETAADTLVDPY